MRIRHLGTLSVALLLCMVFCGIAYAVECSPEEPDAEPLFEIDNFFMGKLDGNLVMFFKSRDGGKDIGLTLDKQQASELLSYALKARDAVPGMNPFAPLGDAQVPKLQQRPMEPLLLDTSNGQALCAHVVGRDYRNESFFADFLLAPAGNDGPPENEYMLVLTIYETPPTYPKGKIVIDKATGLPVEKSSSQAPGWGEEFSGFLSALQDFTGSKILIIE